MMKRARRTREVQPHSPLALYLLEINRTPLLTREQERVLAQSVAAGDPVAREQMVRANLRLVVSVARRYTGKGLSLEDLIEEGNLGLLRAVEGFDPAMQTRLSTYATFWIKQAIRRALVNTGRLVRVPSYVSDLLSAYRRTGSQLREKLGRPPSVEEVAAHLRLPPRKAHILRQAIRARSETVPLERPRAARSLAEVLVDGRSGRPEATMSQQDDQQRILRLLGTLEPREAAVVRMRFGLVDQPPQTLQQIGVQLGLTRERVRQIEKQALARLGDLLEADSPPVDSAMHE